MIRFLSVSEVRGVRYSGDILEQCVPRRRTSTLTTTLEELRVHAHLWQSTSGLLATLTAGHNTVGWN